jgi:3-hydroxymyristoyl/3-hydroxydecanoyl-(acyl carrier protein) dehydratase
MINPAKVFHSISPIVPAATGSGAKQVAKWTLPADLPYLNGHFPQNPIFPAVGILDASTFLVQRTLNQPDLQVRSVDIAKFLQPIVPNQSVQIELSKAGESSWQVEWKEDGTEKLLATLKLSF